jgi:hypothetical protein
VWAKCKRYIFAQQQQSHLSLRFPKERFRRATRSPTARLSTTMYVTLLGARRVHFVLAMAINWMTRKQAWLTIAVVRVLF